MIFMLGLKHHCPVCGIDVEKESGIKRFGKYFCSDEHTQQYSERKTRDEENNNGRKGGGCC